MYIKQYLIIILIFATISCLHATINIESVNSTSVGLYKKFEVIYDLDNFDYDNPFDPDQIDVTAVFTSPSGKEWNLFGFYDNYENADAWKIRFAPNEIGEWTFVIYATDADKSDQSEVQTFSAVESEHHGWIKVSEENPRYMEHDDGTSYFGVGMYTPWSNDVAKFDKLQEFGGNTFAIWNINYGGMVNGFGLIEEELGRYNQTKCGKMDELIQVAEERDMTIMYCFWPHDLFSATVWATQWQNNPYRFICDVEDVYSDEECWRYQEKKYRYLIARFSYSRAWGIWEIMNEINGTDGWAAGRRQEAENWVKRVHDYLKANDPYSHPTTASRSGGYGEYWGEVYELFDLPNLHVYETQGWPEQYPGNTLRSSMYNYAFAAARFWNTFDQPGILGEAGYDWVRVDVRSPEYVALYHNAIWASLMNGIAGAPYWWTFTNPIRDEEREQMLYLSRFVADIDFVKQSKAHFQDITDEYDLYGMKNDSTAFGWLRQVDALDVSGLQFELENVLHPDVPVYAISYFNPWTGDSVATHIRPHVNNRLTDVIPELDQQTPDIAFKITTAEAGETPTRVGMSSSTRRTVNIDTLTIDVTCYLFDAENRFCPDANAPITLSLEGPGSLSASEINAVSGAATFMYQSSEETGVARIFASSPGLVSDTLSIRIQDKVILDDFETYRSDAELQSEWRTRSGEAVLSLDTEHGDGQSLKLEYGIGPQFKFTAVIEKEINRSFQGGQYLAFWIEPDGSNRQVDIRIYNQNRRYWDYSFYLVNTRPGIMSIPLEEFEARDESVPFDLSILSSIRLTIRRGDGVDGTGALYFDDFKFPPTAPTIVQEKSDTETTQHFELGRNFPNPFNSLTHFVYQLPQQTHVNVSIFNVQGQLVDTLVDKTQASGAYSIAWEAKNALSSGVYFYQLKATDFVAVRKCLLTK